MKDPKKIKEIVLGEGKAGIEQIIAVARYGAKVKLSEKYCERVRSSRKIVEKFVRDKKAMYGITTGFGDNWNKAISPEETETLQRNILLSHATSVGEPLEKEVVRGILMMMLLNMGQGYSGVRVELLRHIAELLNHDVTPYAPEHGSVGYLCPEAHIGLVLIGEGKAWYGERLMTGAEALAEAGMKPITLSSKEGLAITSGTTSVTALTVFALYDAINLAKAADVAGAMSLEALRGTTMAFNSKIQDVRPHPDQKKTADNILRLLKDSEIADKYRNYRLQDALSIRCIPQLHGAYKKKLIDALEVISIEINSCCDNPLVFPNGDGLVLMGCNADGSYVGMEADTICIAMTSLAKMSERRIDRLLNHHVSELPSFLIENTGLNSGFMITQYSAAGILGEMRVLSHPATVDNVSTCANQEDYVSMGYNAARKAYKVSGLLEYVIAIELMCAAQGMEFLAPLQPSTPTGAVCKLIRSSVPKIEKDGFMNPHIEYIHDLIHEGIIVSVVENIIGELEI
ncbi:MAG: histidine ammonia-lyase [Caulobacteraceae bacterium]